MSIQSEALSRIRGYVDPGDAGPRIAAVQDAINRASRERVSDAASAFERSLATSWDLEEMVAAFEKQEALKTRVIALNEIRGRLRTMATALRENRRRDDDDLAPALQFLHTKLGETMATVRDLDRRLRGIHDLSDVVNGTDDQMQAWRALTDCVATYEEIRATQGIVCVHLSTSASGSQLRPQRLHQIGYLKDAFGLETFFIDVRRNASNRARTRFNARVLDWLASFPTSPVWDRLESTIWPSDDRHSYLRWLATTGKPWVPTIAELDSAADNIAALTADLTDPTRVEAALAAYDAYYDDRGVKPVRSLDTAALRAELPSRPRVRIGPSIANEVAPPGPGSGTNGRGQTDPRLLAALGEG